MSRDVLKVDDASVEARFAPSLITVDRVVDVVKDVLGEAGTNGATFGFQLALREALVNAVVHGSAGCSEPRVTARVRLEGASVTAEVADLGPGFDWGGWIGRPIEDHQTHGRGIALIRRYCDEVVFNTEGNRITFACHLPADAGHPDPGGGTR